MHQVIIGWRPRVPERRSQCSRDVQRAGQERPFRNSAPEGYELLRDSERRRHATLNRPFVAGIRESQREGDWRRPPGSPRDIDRNRRDAGRIESAAQKDPRRSLVERALDRSFEHRVETLELFLRHPLDRLSRRQRIPVPLDLEVSSVGHQPMT